MHRVELKVLFKSQHCDRDIVFLMHRVELKVLETALDTFRAASVPNAPCGVERLSIHIHFLFCKLFLMHRVELKVRI